jgi:hypothetical protein
MIPSKSPWIPVLTLLATAASAGGFVFFSTAADAPAAQLPVGSDVRTPVPHGVSAVSAESSQAQRSELGWRAPEQLRSGLFSVAAGTSLSFDVENASASQVLKHAGGTLQALELERRGRTRVDATARRGGEAAVSQRLSSFKLE